MLTHTCAPCRTSTAMQLQANMKSPWLQVRKLERKWKQCHNPLHDPSTDAYRQAEAEAAQKLDQRRAEKVRASQDGAHVAHRPGGFKIPVQFVWPAWHDLTCACGLPRCRSANDKRHMLRKSRACLGQCRRMSRRQSGGEVSSCSAHCPGVLAMLTQCERVAKTAVRLRAGDIRLPAGLSSCVRHVYIRGVRRPCNLAAASSS